MEIETIVRSLAKSNYWQTLYSHFKENGMKLFKNDGDYSNGQIWFLNYLNMYFNLYTDIAMDEVDEAVLNDFVYEEAYLHWKRKKRIQKEIDNNLKKEKTNTPTTTWVFKAKRNGNRKIRN